MKTNEYVKFLTKTLVEYYDEPKEKRKERKLEKKGVQQPGLYKWFGIMPYVVKEEIKWIKRKGRGTSNQS
ncbi:YqzE family protein [Fervidibacillus albus]|uniref:YqzE family protein n=1 Tax=Fervidibacillus albus TaxID=2980026 RepID=A0A9E8LVG5_9BACI|nr:YqzE family protein [Fervidibacillus albus]WAA10437.1 YqzE family protein [Fervidibacillus albus]